MIASCINRSLHKTTEIFTFIYIYIYISKEKHFIYVLRRTCVGGSLKIRPSFFFHNVTVIVERNGIGIAGSIPKRVYFHFISY